MTILSAVPEVEETPLGQFLIDQANLSAVERFSQRHESELVPRQARYYRDLIPASRPQAGQQFAFEVDLDVCTGCKACVSACHSLNGLDDDESWRSVTLLRGTDAAQPIQQTVTAACHHCADPACLSGCPVDAYEKDGLTGIVSHLDDQCIGCGYCTLSCPYEVPVYNHRRGIVRKCDMCKDRLAAGEAPVCVQACPNEAITIAVVDVADARRRAAGDALVPGAPPSAITVPTTLYTSAKGRLGRLGTGASAVAGPARAHPPLAMMLVLTQLSVGAFLTDLVLRLVGDRGAGLAQTVDAGVAVASGVLALGASVLHLGRPRYFSRAVIGLRHSWLSREVLAFGVFTGLAVPYALALWLAPGRTSALVTFLGAAVAGAGLAGVACSVLIYTTTHRASWSPAIVGSKFGLTTGVCGLATVLWVSAVTSRMADGPRLPFDRWLPALLAALVVLKLVVERSWLQSPHEELRVTATRRRVAALAGGVALPVALAILDVQPSLLRVAVATASLVGIVMGELCERSLFFTTASRPR